MRVVGRTRTCKLNPSKLQITVVAATLLLPGIGPVFALGFGAAALLGLAGAGAGSRVGAAVSHDAEAPKRTPDDKWSEDAALFREVLKEGGLLIVVRRECEEVATWSCGV